MPTVDILLATYNGARFLPELLESLSAQAHGDWRLIARDDGSTDGSVELIENWAETAPQQVRILDDGESGLGASGNFARLLAASDSPYFAFCDQDDVWSPDKVERLLEETLRAERGAGSDVPILTHCDLTVVGESLVVLRESFWDQQGFKVRGLRRGDGGRSARRSLVMRNVVTGCAMMGNARLRELSAPVPPDCVMHDWWVALVAGFLGEIRTVEAPCILYRQHGSNSLGAKGWSLFSVLRRSAAKPGRALRRSRSWLGASRRQAEHLVSRFGARLPAEEIAYLEDYARRGPGHGLARKTFLLRHRVWPQSWVRALIMVLIM